MIWIKIYLMKGSYSNLFKNTILVEKCKFQNKIMGTMFECNFFNIGCVLAEKMQKTQNAGNISGKGKWKVLYSATQTLSNIASMSVWGWALDSIILLSVLNQPGSPGLPATAPRLVFTCEHSPASCLSKLQPILAKYEWLTLHCRVYLYDGKTLL